MEKYQATQYQNIEDMTLEQIEKEIEFSYDRIEDLESRLTDVRGFNIGAFHVIAGLLIISLFIGVIYKYTN
jgi:hypothetical protein